MDLWAAVPDSQQIPLNPPIAQARALAFTGQYVAVGTNDNGVTLGSLQLLDPETGSLVHWFNPTGAGHEVECIDSDGFGLLIGHNQIDNISVRRLYLNPPPAVIRRARLLGDDRSRQPWHKKHTIQGVF
jgi:hypothetical protein